MLTTAFFLEVLDYFEDLDRLDTLELDLPTFDEVLGGRGGRSAFLSMWSGAGSFEESS